MRSAILVLSAAWLPLLSLAATAANRVAPVSPSATSRQPVTPQSAAPLAPARPPAQPTVRSYQSGRWYVWRTENFRICTTDSQRNLRDLALHCEDLKTRLESIWFADASGERAWDPPCDVLVHANLKDYQRSLGAEVGDSVGVTTMQYDRGRVLTRRVDVRIDAEGWRVDALPHELTHVVIADRFGNRPLPPWLDEGIGILSESDSLRRQRVAAYEEARGRGTVYQTRELVTLRSFPHPDYRDAFYVQSAAMVRMLCERNGPEGFARFARRSLDSGLDRALRETYEIAGVGELQNSFQKADAGRLVSQGGLLESAAPLMAEAEAAD